MVHQAPCAWRMATDLAAFLELLEGEFADRLQHQVAGLASGRRFLAEETLVHERGDAIDDPGAVERSTGETASAASSVKPPTKTPSRRKSACSSASSRS